VSSELTPEKTVLLVGAPASVLRRAKDLGLDVILVQHKNKYAKEQAGLADVTFIADFTDWPTMRKVAEAAHHAWGFAAAVSLTDPGTVVAARINELYGLGGTAGEVSERFMHKLTMRRRLAEAGPGSGVTVIGAEPLDGRASLEEFAERYGYPVIVKPTDAAASIGVHRVDGPDDVDDVLAKVGHLRDHGSNACGNLFALDQFFMEEFVSGPEYSVEAFSFGGRHVVVAVTEKLTGEGHFAELGHTVPARLSVTAEDEVVAATERFLDLMGLTDGPSHTEVRLGPDGPVVIESHNRIGGDRIDELVAAAYDLDLKTYAVAWPFGLVEPLPDRPRPARAACLRVVPGEPGRVVEISGVDEAKAHPDAFIVDVDVRVGDVIAPLRDNNDRVGMVAVTGADSEVAVKLADELIATTVRVRVEQP
jgi:biotin carboxylase